MGDLLFKQKTLILQLFFTSKYNVSINFLNQICNQNINLFKT